MRTKLDIRKLEDSFHLTKQSHKKKKNRPAKIKQVRIPKRMRPHTWTAHKTPPYGQSPDSPLAREAHFHFYKNPEGYQNHESP